jgi:DNA polymerase-3 subunit delta'
MIVGHQKQLEFIDKAALSGRRGHAYIFCGPSQVGKKLAAFEWLSRLFKEKISQGCAHPDFLFVAPLIDSKTSKIADEITVDQIRGLINKFSLKPSLGKYKAVIIDEAQKMNGEAQNCLLKTLEEPTGDALLILITRNSHQLLSTIRSRCETLQFNFVAESEIEKMAKDMVFENGNKIDEVFLGDAVKLAFGRPGRAAEFIADKSKIEKWRQREKEFAQIINSELPEKFAYVAKIIEDGNITETIEIWQWHFRNLLLETLKSRRVPDSADSAESGTLRSLPVSSSGEVAPKFVFSKAKPVPQSPEKIADILKKIHELSVILQTTNASPKLTIEYFMLEI